MVKDKKELRLGSSLVPRMLFNFLVVSNPFCDSQNLNRYHRQILALQLTLERVRKHQSDANIFQDRNDELKGIHFHLLNDAIESEGLTKNF